MTELSNKTVKNIKINTFNSLYGRPFSDKFVRGVIATDRQWLQSYLKDLKHDFAFCGIIEYADDIRDIERYLTAAN